MILNMFLLKVKEILTDYDPSFMAMSLDEAYLNITKHLEENKGKYVHDFGVGNDFLNTQNVLRQEKKRAIIQH